MNAKVPIQITSFAWIIVVLNVITGAGAIVSPWILGIIYRLRLGEFLGNEQVAELVRHETQAALPWLAGAVSLSLAGLICGVGMLRSRMWGRSGWMILSALGVIFFASQLPRISWDRGVIVGLILRSAVLIVSVWFLRRPEIEIAFGLYPSSTQLESPPKK